jgi:hypothetical protein
MPRWIVIALLGVTVFAMLGPSLLSDPALDAAVSWVFVAALVVMLAVWIRWRLWPTLVHAGHQLRLLSPIDILGRAFGAVAAVAAVVFVIALTGAVVTEMPPDLAATLGGATILATTWVWGVLPFFVLGGLVYWLVHGLIRDGVASGIRRARRP